MKRTNEKNANCDDKDGVTVFYPKLLITHRQERNNSDVSQLQLFTLKSCSFALTPG